MGRLDAHVRTRGAIVEVELLMDKVAHRLHACPTGFGVPELRPSKIQQMAVDLAITAGQQELQRVVGQFMWLQMWRLPMLRVGQAAVAHGGAT
jgi:hypothetical protein